MPHSVAVTEREEEVNPIRFEPAATGYLPAVLHNTLGWRGEQLRSALREPKRVRAWLDYHAKSEGRSSLVWRGFEAGGWPPDS